MDSWRHQTEGRPASKGEAPRASEGRRALEPVGSQQASREWGHPNKETSSISSNTKEYVTRRKAIRSHEVSNGNGNVWKWIAGILATALVSGGAGTYVGTVDASPGGDIIALESRIVTTLQSMARVHEKDIDVVRKVSATQSERLSNIEMSLGRVEGKLDILIRTTNGKVEN